VRRLGVALLKLAVTVVVTWFVLRAVGLSMADLRDVDSADWDFQLIPFLGSVILLVIGYGISGLLWGKMVAELGGPVLEGRDAIRVYMIANLGRYIPGKVWQIIGLAALAKARGVPAPIATGAAVLGQLIAVSSATLLGLGVFFGANAEWRLYGWIGLGATLLLCLVISIPATLDRLVDGLFRLARQDKPGRRLGRSTFGVRWILYYLANWGVYSTAFWLLYLGFQPFEPFLRIGPAFAAAYVMGYVVLVAPAGGGVREGALVLFLSPVASPAVGAAVAIIARAWTTIVELAPAAAFWMHEQRRQA
jgi:glycosyltransferase 2 family protein